jgi:hypothetical protein
MPALHQVLATSDVKLRASVVRRPGRLIQADGGAANRTGESASDALGASVLAEIEAYRILFRLLGIYVPASH